ncbi:hypothetical protein [Sporocytophaga myxococcoides]|uniref:hypothetical protein n=1 Tax=Sporocytophaga myxococcoides TaxID=153721 RepID=UPI0003FAB137|nr:hypothetical protein [Sporocytophaga myxococcoides]
MKSFILLSSFWVLFYTHSIAGDTDRSTAPLRKKTDLSLSLPKKPRETFIYVATPQQDKYTHPLKKVGKILTFSGLPLVLAGTMMVANADALYYNCNNGYCEGDPMGGFGVVILAAGIGVTTTGAILWGIGASKSSND